MSGNDELKDKNERRGLGLYVTKTGTIVNGAVTRNFVILKRERRGAPPRGGEANQTRREEDS
jgi:hypothetical protein